MLKGHLCKTPNVFRIFNFDLKLGHTFKNIPLPVSMKNRKPISTKMFWYGGKNKKNVPFFRAKTTNQESAWNFVLLKICTEMRKRGRKDVYHCNRGEHRKIFEVGGGIFFRIIKRQN